MGQLTPIQLEDGTTIYIEAVDNKYSTSSPSLSRPSDPDNPQRGLFPEPAKQLAQNFQAIEGTIRAYTSYTLRAFRNLALAEVSEVTLKFGISVDIQTGLPYIANGQAGCNTEITVKCTFSP